MDRRQRIARVALDHAGCSALSSVDKYKELVLRPADPPTAAAYYLESATLSTCALACLGILRLAGCEQPECCAAYVPARIGRAVSDIVGLASRYSAWVTGAGPVPPLQCGDAWVITNDAGDSHVGVCVEDVWVSGDTWRGDGVEGGQSDGRGWTAIDRFDRTWRHVGNRWYLGNRYLLGYADAGRMPIPDTIDDTSAPVA